MLCDDFLPFDPWVLEIINFEIPSNPSQRIDTTTYVNKAETEYGEEFAKKVDGNLRILVEAMNRRSGYCDGGEKEACCKGKCWGGTRKVGGGQCAISLNTEGGGERGRSYALEGIRRSGTEWLLLGLFTDRR